MSRKQKLPKDYDSLKEKIADSISHYEKSRALGAATKRSRNARTTQLLSLADPEGLLSDVKRLKTSAISNLDVLLEQFVSSCEKNGSKVLVAKTGQDVVNYVVDLAL